MFAVATHIIACNFLALINSLLSNQRAAHAAAIAADPALQQAIVRVLMEHCLPSAAALVAGPAPAGVPLESRRSAMLAATIDVIQHGSLAPAVDRHLQTGAEAEAAVRHAVVMLRALPISPHSAGPGQECKDLASATALLGTLCQRVLRGAQLSAADGNSEASQLVSWRQGEAVVAAGRHAVRVLPHLAASLAAQAAAFQAHGTPGPRPVDLNTTCHSLRWPLFSACALELQVLMPNLGQPDSAPQQLSCCLEAMAASLQLLPCLSQLDAPLRQHSGSFDGASSLCSDISSLLVDEWEHQLSQLPLWLQQLSSIASQLPPEQAAWDSLLVQLWGLHTSLCRLVAALSLPGAPLLLPGVQLTQHHWQMLQASLCAVLVAMAEGVQLMQQPASTDVVQLAKDAPRQVVWGRLEVLIDRALCVSSAPHGFFALFLEFGAGKRSASCALFVLATCQQCKR